MAAENHLLVDVRFLPSELKQSHLVGRSVVVFDVLRATTSITAALDAGVSSIRIFASPADAMNSRERYPGVLLCGEEKCLPPAGFDLGNTPGAFKRSLHANRHLLMSTTNGTRAILAASGAAHIYAGALVNAAAVAKQLSANNLPVTLLCAGTNGAVAMEDVLGAGAVMAALDDGAALESDTAVMAQRLFAASHGDLPALLRLTQGGRNLIQAGLEADIDFAARLNVMQAVGVVSADEPPIITRTQSQ